MASEGVLFVNSYCNSPLSGPSRASMQTGKYPHHNGAFNFQLKHNEYDCANPMVPEVMRSAGYHASGFGKLGYYIYKYAEPMNFVYPESHYQTMVTEREIERAQICDFSTPTIEDKNATYHTLERWHYPDNSNVTIKLTRKPELESEEDRDTREAFYSKQHVVLANNKFEILAGESTMPTEKTEDGRILQVFSEYLDNADKIYKSVVGKDITGALTREPQFINLGFHFPHTPVMPSKEYRDEFKKHKYTLPEFDTKEIEKMPKQMQAWQRNFSFLNYTPEQQEDMIQDYYAFCAMGDEMIGQAVERFKKYCDDNNQPYLIVFGCGDHGWHLGEQGAYFKTANFLKSNQTAMIVVSSDKEKFPAGKVVTDFTEYVDFAPTFYAAAGIDINSEEYEFLDGRDLAQTASGEVTPRDYVIGEVGNRAFLRGKDFAFSMRSRKNNGNPTMEHLPNENVRWPMDCAPEDADMGLYDLRVDPRESNNVAYDKEYKELAAWFRNKLGNIVLGDGRFEAVWDQKNVYNISDFALGSDDKKLDIPAKIIPKVKVKK